MARKFWWPKSLPEQYQKVKELRQKIAGYQIPLGLTNALVTAYEALCDAFCQTYDFRGATEQTDQAVTEWRDQVWYGTPKGDAVSPAPVFAVMGAVTFTRGTVPQIFEMREYILALPGYTEAIGEDLGFIGPEEQAEDPSAAKPTLVGKAAEMGGLGYAVIITGRGKSDQWKLSGAVFGTANWQDLGTFTGKTFEGTWPGGGTQPIQIQLRVQLYKDNQPYGIPSDIIVITIFP